jgi:hypothetical protein
MLLKAIATTALLWDKASQDGTLKAAGRQGIDELGAALKAFPDSIQAQESGSIFNPTQGEIAADRCDDHSGGFGQARYYSSYSHTAGSQESWPSDIAKNSQSQDAGQNYGHDQGQDHGHNQSDGCSM